MDNFGGISNFFVVYASQIEKMNINGLKCSPSLKTGSSWLEILFGQYGCSIASTPEVSSSGTIYNVSVSVNIPEQLMTDDMMNILYKMNGHDLIAKYQTLLGYTYVIGTKNNPLRSMLQHQQANQPGNGFNGYIFTLSGKQTEVPLLLN